MGALISALLSFFANQFSATKLILYALFVAILPVVLWNVWVEISEFILSVISSSFSAISIDQTFSFSFDSISSLASWLASQLRLAEAFTMFISSLSIRLFVDFLLRFFLR